MYEERPTLCHEECEHNVRKTVCTYTDIFAGTTSRSPPLGSPCPYGQGKPTNKDNQSERRGIWHCDKGLLGLVDFTIKQQTDLG